jgi:hypothetical protein
MPVKREDDSLSKSDLDTIIEVNKKAIEVQIEVAAQNEKVIEDLEENIKISEGLKRDTESTLKELSSLKEDIKDFKKDIEKKIDDDVKKKIDELDKSQFKIYAILTTGSIAVILQIIQIILGFKK